MISFRRSNDVNSSYGYDNAGRLTNISHDGSGGNLLFTNYTLDANGNRTTMASNAGSESYTLDVLNRLTNATYPNGDTAAYSYDANGNRLSQTFNGVTTNYSYDDAGQLLSDGATTYSYDANGNLITAGADSYTWDWANRMTAATVGGNNASYAYDAFDVRVSGAVNGAATNYLWDRLAQNPTLVDDGGHAYVHGVGPQAQIDPSGNRHYLLSDALSSIRGVTDSSGALVGNTGYDAFGAVRSQIGSNSALGYTGELYTPATGLLHLRARDLNPALGRFLSVDTVQPNAPGSQGFNGYAYVVNNPTLWVDPSGHTSTSGYFGTAQFLPLFLGVAAFALAASLATQIELTLAEGRNPQSWSFGNHTATTNLVLTTFAMVLRCALIPGCMDAVGGIGNATKEFGSDAPGGVTGWTPDALPNAWSDYPAAPPVVAPAPITNPGPTSPAPDPGSKGPPGWFWPVAGALAALAAWTAYQYFSPAPARDPFTGPDPANDPVSPPGATATPNMPKMNIYYSGADQYSVSKHIQFAINNRNKTSMLTYFPRGHPRGWYRNVPPCKGNVTSQSGKSCDEYPFASTVQGGPGASLELVPVADQNLQRRALDQFYRDCGIYTATNVVDREFKVEVTFSQATHHVCKN